MTEFSQNGWSVIGATSTKWWNIIESPRKFQLRRGSAGFVLIHLCDWFDREIENLDPSVDDFGWSPRKIAGSDTWSNHASGTALDLNSVKHPQGQRGTFTREQTSQINKALETRYEGLLRWGGNFTTTTDEMHYEVLGDAAEMLVLGKKLEETPRGRRLLKIN